MDVERIQKINTLALDLMKRGLAADREDAVVQAEKVYRSRDGSEDYSNIRETMQNVQAEGQKNQPTATAADLTPTKVSEILEQNTKFLVAKIKEFQDKVTALEGEVASLKSRVSYNRPAPEAPPRGSEESVAARAPAQSASNAQSAPNHPRSGNYNDKDVSIEKFFYMGNKK
ncbi:TPA: hypothetical protein HA242_01290 [Candidatus Woesearchaeota archaeon]|nr:hypothetical protein [Candidatus Woesearchaeota archaeon]HIG93547.1 hypothetical protein [Candidatus Woesearchaeota archaeon]HIH12332.1 hypothetical protein [Candidatus Woesearchaeota archaeon]